MIHYKLTGFARWTGDSLYEEVRQINEELHGEFHGDVRQRAEKILNDLFLQEKKNFVDFEMVATLERVIPHGMFRYRAHASDNGSSNGHFVFIPPKK